MSNGKQRKHVLTASEEAEEADEIGEDDSYDEEDEDFMNDDDETSTEDEDENTEPLFLNKHKKQTPENREEHVCVHCKKVMPALFTDCKHFFSCYHCYLKLYAPSARPRHPLPSFCAVCEEQVLSYFYIIGSLEDEENRQENQGRVKRRCTLALAPFVERMITTVMPGGYYSPDLLKCSVDGCKRAGRYMAYHRKIETNEKHACYTQICADHQDKLLKECPICKEDVTGYYKHERAK